MSSDVVGGSVGCRVRFEVAVTDFERFLLVGKGMSAGTRECYVRHVRAMLSRVCDTTGVVDLAGLSAGTQSTARESSRSTRSRKGTTWTPSPTPRAR